MGFYSRLRDKREDDEALQTCIENVVDQLDNADDPRKPGMLLGKIQSGKTRAFLGVIARGFDRDFDIAIVLTKGTKTLASFKVIANSHEREHRDARRLTTLAGRATVAAVRARLNSRQHSIR